jgi:hypothetical protein
MKTTKNQQVSPYRINYGQGQVSGSFTSRKEVSDTFKTWNLGGSFIERCDSDTGEWFPVEPWPASPAAPTTGLVCPVCLSPVSEPWSCVPCSAKYGIQPAIPAPCPSASHLPLVPPVGVSGAKLHRRAPARRAPAPVSPSLPASEESKALDLLLDGMAKLDLVRKVKSLKADVERLRDLLEQAHDDLAVTYKAIEIHGGPDVSVGQFRRLDQYKAAALSLAEVGK